MTILLISLSPYIPCIISREPSYRNFHASLPFVLLHNCRPFSKCHSLFQRDGHKVLDAYLRGTSGDGQSLMGSTLICLADLP